MSEPTLGAGQAIEEIARRMAARQAESLQRYGGLLSKFGSAQLSTRDLGENLYKLAVEETARAFGDAVELGVGYWRGVFNAVTPPTPPTGQRARAAGPSKGRKRKAGGFRSSK